MPVDWTPRHSSSAIVYAVAEARSFRFARHMGYNGLGLVVPAAVNLVSIPYLVSRLGLEAYGLVVILQALPSYAMTASLAAGAAAVKFTADAAPRGEGGRLRDAFVWALLFYGTGVGLAALLLAGGADFVLERAFNVPAALLEDGLYVVRLAALGAVLAGFAQAASSILQGLQRFDLHNAVGLIQGAGMPLLACWAVARGSGARGVAQAFLAAHALAAAAALYFAWAAARRLPERGPRLSFFEFSRLSFSQCLGPFAWIVIFQADKLFLAQAASMAGLTLYAVPAGLLQRLQALPALVSATTLPLMSEARAHEGEAAVARVYLKSLRFVLWACLPPLTLLFSFMPQFLSLWLGGDFGEASVWPARLLCVAQALWLLGVLPASAALAKDAPWFVPALAWAQALLSLILWQALAPRFGLVGVAWGALLGQGLPALFGALWLHMRVLRLGTARWLREGLAAPTASAALALAVSLFIHARATGWLRLAVFVLLGLFVFYVSTWLFMPEEDKGVLRRWLKYEPSPRGGV